MQRRPTPHEGSVFWGPGSPGSLPPHRAIAGDSNSPCLGSVISQALLSKECGPGEAAVPSQEAVGVTFQDQCGWRAIRASSHLFSAGLTILKANHEGQSVDIISNIAGYPKLICDRPSGQSIACSDADKRQSLVPGRFSQPGRDYIYMTVPPWESCILSIEAAHEPESRPQTVCHP